jgi:hypothetical protein
MITVQEYLEQHGKEHLNELTEQDKANAQVTVDRANQLLEAFGSSRGLRSGWRPQAVNDATPNSAKNSKHITCEAIDLDDNDRTLQEWCMDHQDELQRIGLWMEHPIATPSWTHVQIVPPGSGKRAFFPNATYAARFKAEQVT